jgi:hypothetical protein
VISLLLFVLNVILSVVVESAVAAFGFDDGLIIATLATITGILFAPLVEGVESLLERFGRDLQQDV